MPSDEDMRFAAAAFSCPAAGPDADTVNLVHADDFSPPPAWERNVAAYLSGRRYHASSVRAVLDWARAWGSMECCGELMFDARDRAAVEALLPDQGEGAWSNPAYAGTWTLA
jgi:hypothetical protein